MNRNEFETELRQQGYGEVVDRQMEANHFNPEHAHEFDAYVLLLDGEMTIARADGPHVLRAGDTCTISAGTLHSELCGAGGAHYLAGRRHRQRAAS